MATENPSVATTATENPPLLVATETPPVAETPPLVVAIETLPVATTETETPPVAQTPPLVVAIETPHVATTTTETPPVAETPSLVMATESPLIATTATGTPPVAQTPPLVVAIDTRHVATTATEAIPLVVFIIFVLLSTIPGLVTGYFLLKTQSLLWRGDPDCTNLRLEWDLWFYIFLYVIFAVASIGVLFKVIAVQVPGIILLVLTIFSILLINWSVQLGANPYKNHMRIEQVYRLERYAPWAQKFLLRDRGWNDFQNCLIERKICDKPNKRGFYQEGCCSPPPYCGYQEKNQTWVVPKTGRYADNVNCVRWDSDKRKCYDCETCQAVYMNVMNYNWILRGMLLVFGFVVLVAFLMLTVVIIDPSEVRVNDNRSAA